MTDEKRNPIRCDTCRWWDREDDIPMGRCRVNSPQLAGTTDCGAKWPFTTWHDWCAYHQPERRRVSE